MKNKVAVVHDYFVQLGGAERVAEELANILPQASLFAIVATMRKIPDSLLKRPVHTTWMQYLPFIERWYRLYFLLYPLAVGSLDLRDYELVVSSSSGYAKGVRTGKGTVHVCYCHTPMRWAWRFEDYSKQDSLNVFKRSILRGLTRALRSWDWRAAQRPDYFIANSHEIARRIKELYNREATVIPPPIDTGRFTPSDVQGDYYLVLSRLVSYKRLDLAIHACNQLGRNLVVIGKGPDKSRLELLAGPTVQFLGRLPDAEVNRYASQCRALIFPGEEDFGMTPLEISAAGRPTIAYRAGGAVETIVDGVTGVFFDHQTAFDVAAAMLRSEQIDWNQESMRKHAEQFSIQAFHDSIRTFLLRVAPMIDIH